ncbi:hypothetical protein [Tenacibaculum piscium]|uniref:hypothetical protein n=1 Tax=Tenacibaculum piscium TaxID=1458515 RepID=UPI001BE99F64|nr:hypothetical protein [Tenacibaculum piscium]MCG8182393.1 hypothetical protein [Tenacibaculum piscium]MCG8203785.1 hypothetical protein [Tenacibaculum piscium]
MTTTNRKISQRKKVLNYLKNNIATGTMVCDAIGITQKSFTRIKRDLEKIGLLAEVKKKRCENTNRLAWYLTTNNDLVTEINNPY